MEARNRPLKTWYTSIQNGELKLPRFQRFEAWDKHRISSLLQTVVHNLPLGITLILEVGDEEKFISRYLESAPKTDNKVKEHLLDGQQRVTALWRTFHNNYDWQTYFVYLREFDDYEQDGYLEDLSIHHKGRYFKKNGQKYPLWCDDPAQCLRRGFIPTELFKPEDISGEIESWIEAATNHLKPHRDLGVEPLEKFFQYKQRISDKIKELRSIVANYNLPFLSLPPSTDKSVALEVFINMNTNSKPLSTYDIIVAEVESVKGTSLHDLHDSLDEEVPFLSDYDDLSDLILNTSALLQNALPNQRGAWDMDKKEMVKNWDTMKNGLRRMVSFMEAEGIYDKQRLPTNAVLAVISALYSVIPESGDIRGHNERILKKYLWHAFFSDRYENSAATHAYADYMALKRHLTGEADKEGKEVTLHDIPIFKDHSISEIEELLTADWPKRVTIRGRAILAVMCRLGALDFSTGEQINRQSIKNRHYHHVFPDALLKEAEIQSFLALNCSLIFGKTNISIGRKEPLQYLKDRYKWSTPEIIKERLQSHMIPVRELANGGYEGLNEEEKKEKLTKDFDAFLKHRAKVVMKAVHLLIDGHQLSAGSLFE